MKNNFIKNSLVLGLLLLSSIGAIGQTKTLVDTEKVFEKIRKIEIEGGSLDIEYKGQDDLSRVEASAYLESNHHDQDIIFIVIGDVLKISHRMNSYKISNNNKTMGFIKIKGPSQMEIQAKAGSGKGLIENVASKTITLVVGSGIIEGNKLKGDVETSVGSGTIKINNLDGNLSCKIGSGNGSIQQTTGKIKASVSSGSFKIKDANEVDLVISSGSAKLENINQIGEITVSSGSLKAYTSGIGANTNLTASSGSISIQTTSNLDQLNFNMRASSGSIKIGNSNASKDLRIKKGDFPEINGTVSSGSIKISN